MMIQLPLTCRAKVAGTGGVAEKYQVTLQHHLQQIGQRLDWNKPGPPGTVVHSFDQVTDSNHLTKARSWIGGVMTMSPLIQLCFIQCCLYRLIDLMKAGRQFSSSFVPVLIKRQRYSSSSASHSDGNQISAGSLLISRPTFSSFDCAGSPFNDAGTVRDDGR
jgi:hypothetical protein